MSTIASDLGGTPRALKLEALLEGITALAALSGGLSLAVTPDGSATGTPLSLLEGTGFTSFLVPGLLLAVVIGGLNAAAAVLTALHSPRASLASLFAGGSLVVFIVSELLLIHTFHPLQAVFLAVGVTVTLLSLPRIEPR